MEQVLADCCKVFLKIINNLRESGEINQAEFEEMASLKIEFLSKIDL